MDGRNRKRRRHRRTPEVLKNLLIVLLTLSALYLATRAQLYNDLAGGAPSGWVGTLVSFFRQKDPSAPLDTEYDGAPAMAASPVRIAVHNGVERFAVQYDQAQVDQLYASVGGLLSEALATAGAPRPVQESEWRSALQRAGVYFDFLGQVPLEALCAWMAEGTDNPSLSGTVRRVLVAQGGGSTAVLYYHNEADGSYYACETALTFAGHMEDVLEGYGGNSATFAFEFSPDSGYGGLDPYVLVFSTSVSPRIYRGANSLFTEDTVLMDSIQRALSFRPQTSSTYQVSGGIRVREGKETLEVLDSGTITYHVSETEASRYPVRGSGGLTSQIEAARTLAAATVRNLCGGAQLYLAQVETDGTETVLSFGYSLDGAAVRLPDGGCAAQFVIQDGYITGYTLRFRSYEDTGSRGLVLRELQAAAALEALSPEGRELLLCYEDNGGETVEAGWVAG